MFTAPADPVSLQGIIIMQIDFTALSADDIRAIIGNAQAALASKETTPAAPIRVAIEFGSYNDKRYGRPWIARVNTWPVGGRPELVFGGYAGDYRGGEAEIMARPGSIVRWGQKDNRGNNTDARWGVVENNGGVREVRETEARALLAQSKGG